MGNSATPPRVRSSRSAFVEGVDAHMLDLLASRTGIVADAATGPIAAGGKRLRPLLVRAARPAGLDLDPARAETFVRCAIRAAAAVELVHTASLVHDDLLDGATLRRGEPTIDALSGRDVAVAAGDLLFSLAFETLVACRADAGDETTRSAVQVLARASRTLAEGEALQAEQLRDPHLTDEAYFARCAGKTGVLFEASLQLGGILGGAAADDVETLGRFGRIVGIAFQLADDVLDCGPPETESILGKRPGADLRDGTVTLPMLRAATHDERIAPLLARQVREDEIEPLLERIRATGALDLATERAHELRGEADRLLESLDDRFDVDELARIAGASVDRLS